MTSLSSVLHQYHAEVLAPLCHFLDACDLAQLARCNSSFHQLIQNDVLVWKQSFLHKWGQSRALHAAQQHDLLWRDAFARLETLKSAALQGRWFEYEGAWVDEPTGYECSFSISVHCSQKLVAPTPCPPIPPDIEQKSKSLLQVEKQLKARLRRVAAPRMRNSRIIKEDVEWLPYPLSFLHLGRADNQPLQRRDERLLCRGVEYYTHDMRVSAKFLQRNFYEELLDDEDENWLPSVPADVLYQLRHHHVHTYTKPVTGFLPPDDARGVPNNRDLNDVKDRLDDEWSDHKDEKADGQNVRQNHAQDDIVHHYNGQRHNDERKGDRKDEAEEKYCVPVQGVIEWTLTKSGHNNDIRIGRTGQEFVLGFYNKKLRLLYLIGVALDLRGRGLLSPDAYRLHISSDGHSFRGTTCGHNRQWTYPICGATKCFRDNVIALMEEEVKKIKFSELI